MKVILGAISKGGAERRQDRNVVPTNLLGPRLG